MLELTKTLHDPSGLVHKLIFEDGNAIVESVGYAYEGRRVVCLSVQSGCRVGCEFCGTGKRFIRNITTDEMYTQLEETLNVIGEADKVQVMTMSMGEPTDNWSNVKYFVEDVLEHDPSWNVFISTTGLRYEKRLADLLTLGRELPGFGLQFSLHHWNDTVRRKKLGNYPHLLSVPEISAFGKLWSHWSNKPCYFNYICTGEETMMDAIQVALLTDEMHLTCSVWCDTGDFVKGKVEPAERFATLIGIASAKMYPQLQVETSVFNPAGQDTIGGGCGQLLYVQEKLKKLGMK
jgi:23S rRNA (adenine2503-C2)-methyltransferase